MVRWGAGLRGPGAAFVAVREVIGSFAVHAPRDARLIVKVHPLDSNITPWRRVVEDIAAHKGVKDRGFYVDGGDLAQMLVKRKAACW